MTETSTQYFKLGIIVKLINQLIAVLLLLILKKNIKSVRCQVIKE